MATANPFDLLVDDDSDDPSQLLQKIVSAPVKKAQAAPPAAKTAAAQPAKLPSKPLPPAQAVKEARNEAMRGGRGGGRGFGRGRGGGGGGRGVNRDSGNNEHSSGNQGVIEESNGEKAYERRGGYGGPRGGFRGDRRGGFANGNVETEELLNEGEKIVDFDKPLTEEELKGEKKENAVNESKQKEPEDKEMTLEEYQKVLEEKRKALEALKTEERKVEVDKELASMQQLSNKKSSDDIFVKLGTDKDKRKEIAEKEDKSKKSLSINEFLKPAAGERNYTSGVRGRGGRGVSGGRYNQSLSSYAPEAPKIEDPSHFPTLGGK